MVTRFSQFLTSFESLVAEFGMECRIGRGVAMFGSAEYTAMTDANKLTPPARRRPHSVFAD
jgi:hypothetical protein